MKKLLTLSVCGCFLALGCQQLQAQQQEPKPNPTHKQIAEEEEDGPSMFKFEPDIMAKKEAKMARIERARRILDTLDIPERRKRKLLKDLYKNGITDRLSKSVLADINFEDVDE
ncbi:hypothetical protein FGM00_07540 [Aggregatimonas sangjinii]|uniref:Uncharacterized protein n=1 Tax=Aggregatimonas sangjinii TaxID=2583587 RepID=A0A5B7SRH8_9FLAO|nr:hypothetical protein [Aggregatimonas sangjinii]QCW99958.1 hypothetical protein FGM00_07540 [Aggregatimonas sangjinii]